MTTKNNRFGKYHTAGKYFFYTIIGLLVLATGAVLAKMMRDTTGMSELIPYLFIGFGSGIFGQNVGMLCKILSVRNQPELAEQIAIEENDERNVMIREKARAKAYQLMLFVYGALMLTFGLMKVDQVIVITMVIAYLFVVFASCYYYSQLNKQL